MTEQAAEPKLPTKYLTDCKALAAESFKCMELTEGDRTLCDGHFKAYKECLKQEKARKAEINRKKSLF